MAERLVVVRRGFRYPVGASVAAIARAGGLSQMTEAQREGLTFKVVGIGDRCDDMPASAAAVYLERGDIARVVDGPVADKDED